MSACFMIGDRCFSHYTMKWGTIESVSEARAEVCSQGKPTGHYTTWWWVRRDDGELDMLDDYDGQWELARVIPPAVAKRYGYGDDPNPAHGLDEIVARVRAAANATPDTGEGSLGHLRDEFAWEVEDELRKLESDPHASAKVLRADCLLALARWAEGDS